MRYFCPVCDKRFDTDVGECPEDHCALLPVDDPAGLVGREVDGRFEVIELLGSGGMGSVYLARQKSVDRLVALKVMYRRLLEDATLIKRFLLEAKACARLANPHTVVIHDFGKTDDGVLYIAMEYLKGRSLRKKLEETPRLDVYEAARILDQVADSLTEAHANGIIHRDLKPENVFLAETPDDAEFVKVLDFGIARAESLMTSARMTSTGAVLGTPFYICPEMIQGDQIDERADIYALGIMLYEMLAGRLPFVADTPMKILLKHINTDPEPLEVINPDLSIPAAANEFVWSCLAKDRDKRPRNARAFRDGLRDTIERTEFSGLVPMLQLTQTSQGLSVAPDSVAAAAVELSPAPPAPQPARPPVPLPAVRQRRRSLQIVVAICAIAVGIAAGVLLLKSILPSSTVASTAADAAPGKPLPALAGSGDADAGAGAETREPESSPAPAAVASTLPAAAPEPPVAGPIETPPRVKHGAKASPEPRGKTAGARSAGSNAIDDLLPDVQKKKKKGESATARKVEALIP
ncbi:MAG: serine/threonine protein kinase [Deltaproteobacteria bacterium]|nr:serine/threonine protein kinase [Deltaproteobacteria bacterium]